MATTSKFREIRSTSRFAHSVRVMSNSPCLRLCFGNAMTGRQRSGQTGGPNDENAQYRPMAAAGESRSARGRNHRRAVFMGARALQPEGHARFTRHARWQLREQPAASRRHGGSLRCLLSLSLARDFHHFALGLGGPGGARRLRLLLVPPPEPRGALLVGGACEPPFVAGVQLVHGAPPAVDRGAGRHLGAVVRACTHRLPAAHDFPAERVQSALPRLATHASHPPHAGLVRVLVQHPLAPPRAPRLEPALCGPQLRRRLHGVGPYVRYLRGGTRRRPAEVRAHP